MVRWMIMISVTVCKNHLVETTDIKLTNHQFSWQTLAEFDPHPDPQSHSCVSGIYITKRPFRLHIGKSNPSIDPLTMANLT
jgi:hypothetical protein